MKRSLLLLLCIATLGLASCEKETIIQETPNRTFIYEISPDKWVLRDNGLRYEAQLDIPEIDGITLDDEGVLVYLDHPYKSTSLIQVPYTLDVLAASYELYNGGIKISIESSDWQESDPVAPENTVTAKIVLIPSRYIP